MNTKIQAFTCAILVGFSTTSFSEAPNTMPEAYNNGPKLVDNGLFIAEIKAYSLYEGLLQMAEANIHATSCSLSEGIYPLFAYTDDSENPDQNQITLGSLNGQAAVTLQVNHMATNSFHGTMVNVIQSGNGFFNGPAINDFTSSISINKLNSVMTFSGKMSVEQIINHPDQYQSSGIKDFYTETASNQFRYILDWGLQTLSKLGYPTEKYWQRSKTMRDNGVIGRTVFVKDRLVGASACRILIDSSGLNSENLFLQNGTLTISNDTPSTPVIQFSQF